jgi:hypothetical protein
MATTKEFSDDEVGYRAWLNRNPEGYVVNQRWGTYLRLHSARCRFVDLPGTKHTNPDARSTKVCSDDRAALDMWVAAKYGRPPDPCGSCKP